MTQWQLAKPQPSRWLSAFAFLLMCGVSSGAAQSTQSSEEFRVYTEHPRLLLPTKRQRLLRRERERDSMRWRQLETLVVGNAVMPEPGFTGALYYIASGNTTAGKKAIEWALGPASDLRQLAIVFDWCQPLLTESQRRQLEQKIRAAVVLRLREHGLTAQRDLAFAAIATAEDDMEGTEARLRDLVAQWWRKGLAIRLTAGGNLDPGGETQALFELLHAIRDNTGIDLRDDAPNYFKALPAYQIICNYPAPYPAAENEYRIPVFPGSGEPDLQRAALARAAGLSMVAYDNNELENQFLQGWLMQDRFALRGTFGAPYEFMWANPYQPGLSYAHLPLVVHDDRSGALFLRSSWEEDATWFALNMGGRPQLFRDGKITVLSLTTAGSQDSIPVGNAAVAVLRSGKVYMGAGERMFFIGGRPKAKYDVEVDDEELMQLETDPAGTLEVKLPAGIELRVRIKEVSNEYD